MKINDHRGTVASPRRRAGRALLSVTAVVALGVAGIGITAAPASADTAPPPGQPATVTTDALPTWQINGVAWAQAVAGSTVYVGGSFTAARPPGSAAGVNEVAAGNVFAYDITTGNRVTTFNHSTNGQVRTVAASPDGKRIYIGGDFTTVDGVAASHIAAFDTATNTLATAFAASISNTVYGITATNTTVYAGGGFGTADGSGRGGLAAFRATNGSLLPWAPVKDTNVVRALVVTPDGSRVIIGGSFLTMNGNPAPGTASVDAVTGASMPWALNTIIKNYGSDSTISSLTTDGTYIYGSGWTFRGGGGSGNFEGTFGADPSTGNVRFVNDCHGDTYTVFPSPNTPILYTSGHTHTCEWIGAFKNFPTWIYRHGLAFSTIPSTTNTGPDDYGWNYNGQPASSLYQFYPTMTDGTYTGQNQATWTVAGNANYVAYGGEFPTVNGNSQQGLTRFALPSIAPKRVGPNSSSVFAPTVASTVAGQARLSWPVALDKDNTLLTYALYRDAETTPFSTQQFASTPWSFDTLHAIDSASAPGSVHTYKVRVTDPNGNYVTSAASLPVTIATTSAGSYVQDVIGDGAQQFWRFGEASGTTAADTAGSTPLPEGTGVVDGAAGAIAGDADTAATFDGTTNGVARSATVTNGPDVFSAEAWFKTTTHTGGKIVGFGNKLTADSSSYDRHIYMDNAGHIIFGVYNGTTYVITSSGTYNDGSYHHVVGTLGATGMALYVDGVLVGTNGGTTKGQSYYGSWRVGRDTITSWPNSPSSAGFTGTIDDVAIYSKVLTLSQVQKHYTDSGRSVNGTPAPTDAYGIAVTQAKPSLYWRLDETSGSTAADSSGNGLTGTYVGGTTKGVASTVSGATGTAVTFNGSNGGVGEAFSQSSPSTYTASAWFKTTTTAGGKIIGFGSSASGLSSKADRHVWMDTTGALNFGVGLTTQSIVTSSHAYNDGKWHQVVATQGAGGMSLYVDGGLVGGNAVATNDSYVGYWRLGGDASWSGANYFNGTIDEAAVWNSTVLTPAQVSTIYFASPTSANAAPVAMFAAPSCTGLSCSVDGSASTDSDGTIASYSWNWGDGSAVSTGATATHKYAAAGPYTVTLTVTDNVGATGTTTQPVTVTNLPPAAAFAAPVCSGLTCPVDGSASGDPDGTIASYSWNWGDGTAAGTGATASHTYAATGNYTITLTVTDNAGATAQTTQTANAVAPANKPPTAVIGAPSCSFLVCSFSGTGSTDTDGTVASYSWSWGDGTAAGTGATANHTYAASGTYTVTLTVTDNQGATGTASVPVTVSSAFALDTFTRTLASGWGTSNVGGAWTPNNASLFAVTGGVGTMTLAAPSSGPSIYLNTVSSTSTDLRITFATDKAATGGGVYTSIVGRRVVGVGDYRAKVRLLSTGAVSVTLSYVTSAGVETVIRSETTVPGLTYTAGTQLRVRLQVSGTSPTTVQARLWPVSGVEPSTWLVTATDSTAAMQVAGGLGVTTYLSGTATNAPIVESFDDLQAGPVG